MAPKKRERDTEPAHPPVADPLLDDSLPPVKVAAVIAAAASLDAQFDWSKFSGALKARADSEANRTSTWFLHQRVEDLLLDPDGLSGKKVPCFVVVEAKVRTLSPAHYVIREHLPFSDAEDNTPEKVVKIDPEKFFWRPIVADDGTTFINAYLLSSKAAVKKEAAGPQAASTISFGFGGGLPAAAPAASFGFGQAPAATATPPSFGFGAAAPVAPLASATAAPAAISFSFGNGSAAPASNPQTGAASITRDPEVGDLCFTLWSHKNVKQIIRDLKAGSRIVIENFRLTDGTKVKLVMQNDIKDKPEKTAKEILLLRVFAKKNPLVSSFDNYVDNLPLVNEESMAVLQQTKKDLLATESANDESFKALVAAEGPAIAKRLVEAAEERQKIREAQLAELGHVEQLLKDNLLAGRESFRLLKYYPSNEKVRFRPSSKVSGITERNEHVDECHPEAYVWKNPFLTAAK